MDAIEVLNKIIPAIEQIDGGCGPCIREFIDSVNPEIKDLGVYYSYDTGEVELKTII